MSAIDLPFPTAPFPAAGPRPADDPRPEIRLGVGICIGFAACFVGWAALAPLNAAAVAPGVVRVSGERKAVQSLKGGVIQQLNVAEGTRVRAGQVLVRFIGTEALAQERSLTRRMIGLQAEIARLETQRLGDAHVPVPAVFAGLNDADRADATRALAAEQQSLNAIRAVAVARHAALSQRVAQIGSQIDGYRLRRSSVDRQQVLNGQELAGVEQLARKGFATQTRVLALQRSAAGLEGDSGSITSDMASLRNSAGEARMQALQADSDEVETTAKRLRDAQSELETLLPQWQAARDLMAQVDLRAPVAGQVVGLAVHTVGGVAAPGQLLMEIVPSKRALTIEAQVSVADANELTPGQAARVRVTTLHGRQIPVLKGHVTRISADSLSDQRTGQPYYTASIEVPQAELDDLSRAANVAAIRPGTPVEVQVSLQARSALAYWLDPLLSLFRRSLNER